MSDRDEIADGPRPAPDRWGFETRAIHAGQRARPRHRGGRPADQPVDDVRPAGRGRHGGFEYSRSANPTRAALEACLASLEGARHGFAFASGLAAEDAVLRQLRPGAGVVLGGDAYGGTFRLIDKVYGAAGHPWTAVDLTDPGGPGPGLARGHGDRVGRDPTNPAMAVVDIAAVAEVAHDHGALLVVDNTFATPYLQQPLALGADVVVHSSTKYLGGHSDVVGGFAALNDDDLAFGLGFTQNAVGGVPSPVDCYLVQRGVKTLGVRMDRHCDNARAVVEALVGHPAVERVLWPGLPEHPGPRRGQAADARLRRHGVVRGPGRRGGGGGVLRAHRGVHAGRVAGCGRVAGRAPGPHDPRLGRRVGARGRPGPGAAVGRHRVGVRPGRRRPPGPRP